MQGAKSAYFQVFPRIVSFRRLAKLEYGKMRLGEVMKMYLPGKLKQGQGRRLGGSEKPPEIQKETFDLSTATGITNKEKQQVKLVNDWNINHLVGIEVIVTKDDESEVSTKTRSPAYMLGASGNHPGHTAVIMLDGISGCYALDRVRVR